MPIYEYECKKCNSVFEMIVSSSSSEEIKCQKCDSSKVQKLISAAGIKVSKNAPLASSSNCQARGGFT